MTGTGTGLAGVVLAAGAGERLRPLTSLLPKALCPVNNVPLLDLALDRIAPRVTGCAVNVHHGRAALGPHLAARPDPVQISVEEPEALGTAGAIGALRDWIAGRGVLVHNADAYLSAGPEVLDDLVAGWDGSACRLLVQRAPGAGDFGDFGDLRFVGVSLLPWALARELAAEPSGLYEVLWRAEHAAGRLEFVETTATAIDCGTPARYLRANLVASGGRSVVGPGATVDGELVRSVVWPGGQVRRGERLVECVRAGRDVTVAAALEAGWQ